MISSSIGLPSRIYAAKHTRRWHVRCKNETEEEIPPMRTRLLLAAAISAALASPLVAQTAAPTATKAPTVSAGGNLDTIHLRSLQSVLDVREKRQDWHDAAQQAETPLKVDALKDQLTQRLSGLAPRVAKELAAHPQDDALVSIDVFKEPGPDGKQAMISVTFEGMGASIGSDYFSNVLAGQSKPPQAEGVPAGLTPDPEASSYLVFFLGNRGLQAGDIPQPKMRQSVIAVLNHQRDMAAHQDQVAQQQEKALQQQANLQQQATDQAQLAANQQSANQQQTIIPEYPYGIGGAANGYDDGYYYPGVGVPIVITPNGYANTPEWRQHERHREEALEKTHAGRNAVNGTASGNGQPVQPAAEGVNVPPGSAGAVNPRPGSVGTVTPPGSAGVRTPAGSQGVRQPAGEAGAHSNAGQGAVERQAPAPAPAAHEGSAPEGHEAAGGGGGGAPASSGGNAGGGAAGGGAKK